MELEKLKGKTVKGIEIVKEVKSGDAVSGEWSDEALIITFTDGIVLIVKSKATVSGWSSCLEWTLKQ